MNDVTLENSTLRKVGWRLVPLICVCFLLNIIDRTNVGFARLRMQDDLGLSEQMFNLGFGMFYVGYLFFGSAKQSADASLRCSALDCPNHDFMGHRIGINYVRVGPMDERD